jgi:hypothetical protein
MGYGTRLHDWKLDELESMKSVSLLRTPAAYAALALGAHGAVFCA